jgi:hypothetical protein
MRWSDRELVPGPDYRGLFRLHGPEWRSRIAGNFTDIIPETDWDLFDIIGEFSLSDDAAFTFTIRGNELTYEGKTCEFAFLGHTVPAPLGAGGVIRFQILVDRTSLELFVGDGLISASFCFLPGPCEYPLELRADKKEIRIVSFVIHELESVWRSHER